MTRKKKHNSGNAKVVYMFESHKSLGKNNNWSQIPVSFTARVSIQDTRTTSGPQPVDEDYLHRLPHEDANKATSGVC